MRSHFLFQEGQWLGTGQVSFSMSPDVLHFRTKWVILEEESGRFHCTQTVEIVGGDRIINEFFVSKKQPEKFEITLENELLGTFSGTGVVEERSIAWEFREKGTFEGYEIYRTTDESEYTMHAEYLSQDQMRTMIRGRIWKRTTELPEDLLAKDDSEEEFD
jgi:hypothetical protein